MNTNRPDWAGSLSLALVVVVACLCMRDCAMADEAKRHERNLIELCKSQGRVPVINLGRVMGCQ